MKVRLVTFGAGGRKTFTEHETDSIEIVDGGKEYKIMLMPDKWLWIYTDFHLAIVPAGSNGVNVQAFLNLPVEGE
jgi:hypothetical protein